MENEKLVETPFERKAATWLDLVVIIIYFVIVIGVGIGVLRNVYHY